MRNKLITILIIVLFVSCKEDEIDISTDFLLKDRFEVYGLKAIHNYEAPKDFFNYDEQEIGNYYLENRHNSNSNSVRTVTKPITLKTIGKIVKKEEKKYPNIFNLNEKVVNQVKLDFPDLSTEEIIEKQKELIKYYKVCLQYDVIKALSKLGLDESGNKGRISNNNEYSDRDLCLGEELYLIQYINVAGKLADAADDTDVYVTQEYDATTVHTDNIKGNAFKHAVWNVLMSKYVADKIKNINEAISITKGFADEHEECNRSRNQGGDSNMPITDMFIHMDLRNNHIGREYFRNNSYIKVNNYILFKTKKLISPSESEIKNTMKNLADNAACLCSTSMSCVWNIPNSRMLYLKEYVNGFQWPQYCN